MDRIPRWRVGVGEPEEIQPDEPSWDEGQDALRDAEPETLPDAKKPKQSKTASRRRK